MFADTNVERFPAGEEAVISAVVNGKIIGTTATDQPIYEVKINGETNFIAVTVGSNGFIVGANPVSQPR